MKKERDEIFQFPCQLDFKIIAHRKPDIEKTILTIVQKQGISTDNLEISIRPSKNNKYWALSLPLTLHDKQQLDDLHQALNQHDDIIMTL